MNLFVVIYGDPLGGFFIVGPFESWEDGITHGEGIRDCPWWVAPLEPVEVE